MEADGWLRQNNKVWNRICCGLHTHIRYALIPTEIRVVENAEDFVSIASSKKLKMCEKEDILLNFKIWWDMIS